MPKETVLTLDLEPELRDEFLAEAQALRQPASQLLHDLVREFVQRQRDERAYDDFLRVKVARARESIAMGRGHPHDDMEAEFAAWRANPALEGGVKLYWTDEAVQDRLEIRDFIATDNPLAAARLDELFGNAAGRLRDFPHLLGHAGKLPGTRELMPHENYRLVYEIRADTVWVLALVHAARRWPPDRA